MKNLIKEDFLNSLEEEEFYLTPKNKENLIPDAKLSKWQWFKIAINPMKNPYSPLIYCVRYKNNYFYNKILSDYKHAKEFKDFFLKNVELNSETTALDYGCGRGVAIAMLNSLGVKNIIGQDIEVNAYWKKLDGVFVKNPLGTNDFYPYKDNSFNLITVIGVLMYLEKEQIKIFCKEAFRMLKKDGYLLIEDNNSKTVAPNYPFLPIIDRDVFIACLKEAGFEIVMQKTYGNVCKIFPYFMHAISCFFTPKDKFSRFSYAPKNWLEKICINPKGKEPLIVFLAKKP